MSIKVSVYVPTVSEEVVSKISSRFSEYDMECQFQPDFAMDLSKDSGMVSLRLRVHGHEVPQYENVEMLSRFEISFKDFRYAAPVSVNPSINEKLKGCSKQVVIRMHANPTSSFRAGMYFSAFLAEASNGVVYNPRTDSYLEPALALVEFAESIRSYETGLSPEDWITVPFSAWSRC